MENAIVYDALHKRKVFLDSFGEGLETFGVLSFIRMFPEEIRPGFSSPEVIIVCGHVKTTKRERDYKNYTMILYM